MGKDPTDTEDQLKAWIERILVKQKKEQVPRLFDLLDPMHYARTIVDEKTPPMLLIHGENDTLVPADQATRFVNQMHKKVNQDKCNLILVPNGQQ